MKKILFSLLLCCLVLSLSACNQMGETDLSVALLVPQGIHEDDSWLNMIWAGIYGADLNYGSKNENNENKDAYRFVAKKVECTENTTAAYLDEIKTLYDQGFRLIYLPGEEFADALEEAQVLYPQCRFGAIDFIPQTLGNNVSAIQCNSYQSGFTVGLVAALQVEEGRFGGILGQEETGSRQMMEGFVAGIQYANDNCETNIIIEEEDIIQTGTFNDPSLGQQMTALLFDRQVNCIFLAARATGMGGIVEGKYRRANGQDVWLIGSDDDFYTAGIYDGNNSALLTGAMRRYAEPIFRQIEKLLLEGEFDGGTIYTMDLTNYCVGLSSSRNNLTKEVLQVFGEIQEEIKRGILDITPR